MNHLPATDHDHGVTLAHNSVGRVTMCPCGVMTLVMQYLSLRFEPGALRDLHGLLAQALQRLDGAEAAAASAPTAGDAACLH